MIGKNVIKLESVDSTNNYLKLNSNSLEEGTIVVSKIQTSGRGRSDHTWMSEEGNLYFSFILKGWISRSKVFELLARVSVAVIRVLKDFNIESQIKYPNDILIENRKICGILIESYGALEIDYGIIGVGINVNQTNFRELDYKAISIKHFIKEDISTDQVLDKFIREYNELEGVPFEKIFDDYLRYSMIIGKRLDYNDKVYTIKGISDKGKLTLESYEDTIEISLNSIKLKDLY